MDPISVALGLAQFAPAILKWITGSDKSAAVAEKVVDIAKAVTGRPDGPAALTALQADPAAVLKFNEAVMLNETGLEKAYLQDRADARDRDKEFIRAGRINWRADILAFLAVSGLVTCVWFVARDSALPERAVNAIMFVAGVLASAVRDVYGFEFGSSRGSKENGETIRQMLSQK
jgi:hypothetical protein